MKRLISVVLSVIIVTSLLPLGTLTVSASTFAGGDGSPENPYQISTAEQLDAVRNNLDACYVLVNDIDLSKYKNWIPIGDADNPFYGKFNGQNFQIFNVNIKDSSSTKKGGYFGLFGVLGKNCIVESIVVYVNIDIDKNKIDYTENWGDGYSFFVGGIAGVANEYAMAINCKVYGNIDVINCNDVTVGGVLGEGKVSKSINYSDIYVLSNKSSRHANDGTICVGGIVGHSGTVNSLIDRNSNYGNIDATSGHFLYCGGISGKYGYIQYCVNYGDVSGETVYTGAYSSFAGNSNVGGIVGATSSDNTIFSANMGNINAIGTSSFAGGIVGYSSGRISNCYNNSSNIRSLDIKRTKIKKKYVYERVDGNSGRIAGGLSGRKISDCYSISTTKINDFIPQEKTISNDKNGETKDQTYVEKQINIILQNILGILLEGETSVQKGKEIVLKATRYDENGNVAPEGGITWSCDDESVAQITPWGNNVTVKGLKGGKATITASHAESGQKADFEIEVVSYVMTLQGGYTAILDEELEINYAVKQGEEYVHNDLDIKWEIESKDSNNAVKIISDKDNAYTSALTVKGINEGECELVAKVDGAELGRTKIEVLGNLADTINDETIIRAKFLVNNSQYKYYRNYNSVHGMFADEMDLTTSIVKYSLDNYLSIFYKSIYEGKAPDEVTATEFYECVLVKLLNDDENVEVFGKVGDVMSDYILKYGKKLAEQGAKIDDTNKKKLKEICKGLCGDGLEDVGFIDSLLISGKSIETYFEEYAKIYQMASYTNEQIKALKLIKNTTNDKALKTACNNVIKSIEKAQENTAKYAVSGGITKTAEQLGEYAFEEMIGALEKLSPALVTFNLVQEITSPINNILFQADDIESDTIDLYALVVIETALKDAVRSAENIFKSNPTKEKAENLMAVADFYKNVQLYGCDICDSLLENYGEAGDCLGFSCYYS